MNRNRKSGLDYFPLDSFFMSDTKIKCLFIDYGNDGVMTYLYTLSRIYSDNGYYVEISNDFLVDVAFTLSQQREKVIEHISRCLQLDLFDSRMAKLHRILTSVDVQQLYLHAKKKGLGSINPLFSLLGMEENGEQAVPPNEAVGGKNAPNMPFLPPNTPVSPPEVAESPTTAPKVK